MRVALAPGLYEVVYSPRQNAVFVASTGECGGQGAGGKILKLDPESLAVLAEIPLERPGFGLALDDAQDRLYVGNSRDASVTVLDLRSHHTLAVIPLAEKITAPGPDGQPQQRYPHNFRQLVLDPARGRLFAPGLWFDDSALYVIDTRRLQVERVVPGFGFVATGIARDGEHDVLYVSNLQGQVFAVNPQTLTIDRRLEVQADQLLNLAYDAKHQRLLATDQGEAHFDAMRKNLGGLDYHNRSAGHRLVALDPTDGRLLHDTSVGRGPVTLLLDEPRNRLYVTHRESGTVSIHDARTYELLHLVELAAHPNSLALDPATGAVYVTIKNKAGEPGTPESVARIAFFTSRVAWPSPGNPRTH